MQILLAIFGGSNLVLRKYSHHQNHFSMEFLLAISIETVQHELGSKIMNEIKMLIIPYKMDWV